MTRQRRGIALVAVLWVLAILSVMGLGFSIAVRVNTQVTENAIQQAQAAEYARAGIAITFERIKTEAASGKDYCWLGDAWMSYTSDDLGFTFEDGGFSVRVTDEAGKLNINTATQEELLAAIGDEDLVGAIMDWRDSDATSAIGGAEEFAYADRNPPYHARDGRFQTIGELALVAGVQSETLWGKEELIYAEREVGEVRGLADILTTLSIDSNLSREGYVRLNLNTAADEDLLDGLADVLPEDKIRAIISYRDSFQQSGETGPGETGETGMLDETGGTGTPVGPGGGGFGGGPMGTTSSRREQLLARAGVRQLGQGPTTGTPGVGGGTTTPGLGTDLIGETDTSALTGSTSAFPTTGALANVPELSNEDIQAVWDRVTAVEADVIEGRVNLNTASLTVLAATLGDELAERVVTYREAAGPFRTVADLLSVDPDVRQELEFIGDRFTTRSYIFTIEATGAINGTGIVQRVRQMIDVSGDEPNVLVACQY